MVYWKRKGSYKYVSNTGRKRKIGYKNYTDKRAKQLGRAKRVKNYVNNPDKSKKGRIAKNYHKSRKLFNLKVR